MRRTKPGSTSTEPKLCPRRFGRPASRPVLAAILLIAAGCATRTDFPYGRLVDLTYAFDEQTLTWPTSPRFELEVLARGRTEAGYFYTANRFCTAEHGGTHMDAPVHFFEGRNPVDAVALEQLIGPGVLVDVSDACAADRDYAVRVEDFEAWEERHGPIPHAAIVLIRTGWGEYWPDAERYLGTSKRGPDAVAELHFPGLDPEAARWLVRRRAVRAVGIDTASIDPGLSTTFGSHVTLSERNVPAFENVANLDELPPRGFTVLAFPMKIRGGSGGPLRIAAIVSGP